MTFVYFVRLGDSVKVGCATYPLERMRSLLGKDFERGQLLGCLKGGFRQEHEIHRQMKAKYGEPVRGREWFSVPASFTPMEIVSQPILSAKAIGDIRRPRPKGFVARVELPRSLRALVRSTAHLRGMTIQGVLEEALRMWLKAQERKDAA